MPFPLLAQPAVSVINTIKEEKEKFVRNLKSISTDTAIIHPLARFVDAEVKNIFSSLESEAFLPAADKEKAYRSLVYFLKELDRNIAQQKSDIYDIPGSFQSFKSVLTALLHHKPIAPLLVAVGARRSQLLTEAFSQYREATQLDDIAVYKRMAASPQFILQFLESKPGFRFADSLLVDATAHDPLKLAFYLNRDKPGIQDRIRNTKNIYLQQIVSLSNDKNASELLPFLTQIAENKLSPEEILGKRTEVVTYFQLLVNELLEARSSRDSSSILLSPLRKGLRQKAISFYVNQVNDLHDAADATRFASVKGLRPEDIYYIITSGGEELYTSSYLGLYKRLMEHFKPATADSLFDIVKYDNFHIFMRMAANYNVLADFLGRLPREKIEVLVRRFVGGIENDTETGMEKAMDIADSFTALDSATEIRDVFQAELRSNLNRSTANRQYLGTRLYGILLQVFELVNQGDALHKLWAKLGNYEILKREALENKRGEIVQLVLFYGDEDGIASFNNFLKYYGDSKKWEIAKNANWISIRSLFDQQLIIYANLPLDIKEEMDLKAQDSLFAHLQQQSLEPAVLVHRGHSYHLDKTLKRLQPSVKLAILGSCGSYNKAISIASINPDVQVIGSKKTGSKSINDPIIDEINETLMNKEDLLWPEIWKKLTARFSKDGVALNLFNEYFPPSDNLSLFVLKLFNYYNKPA